MITLEQTEATGERTLSDATNSLLRDIRSARSWENGGSGDIPSRIEEEYLSRRRRVLWEGAFFVLVLLGTMGVISKALRGSRLLIKRQQNFIASVTHELRTPLTSLKLSADTLGLRTPDSETSSRLAARMSEDVERLDQMVSQILDSARVEAREEPQASEPVNLHKLLQHEVHKLHCRLAPTGIMLSLKCPEEIYVSANPRDLKTVISNLLSNAVKSCGAAGGGNTVIAASQSGNLAKIMVTDSGRGFDSSEAAHLFKRFYRPGNELRRETTGSGLGLYLVYELTKSHGGSVSAESPGQGLGATFTLTWPTADRHAAQ